MLVSRDLSDRCAPSNIAQRTENIIASNRLRQTLNFFNRFYPVEEDFPVMFLNGAVELAGRAYAAAGHERTITH